MDLELTEACPLWDSATGQRLEGCKSHTGSKWSDWEQGKCWANLQKPGSSIVLSLRPPPTQNHKPMKWWTHPGDYLSSPPIQFTSMLFHNRPCYKDRESKQLYLMHRNKHREAAKLRKQRYMAQMKEQNKTTEKELNKKEITNISDAEFKTLVIRMFKELISTSTA